MDALPPDTRRYDDKEIGRILKRASQLQRAAPTRPDPAGFTLVELEEIAAEAGIDVANLRQAAAELGTPVEGSLQTRFLGAPLTLKIERRLPGELHPDDLDVLIPILQAGTGATGQATTVGKALTWVSSGGNNSRRLQVLVMAQVGETRIRVEERSTDVALGLHLGISSGSIGLGLPAGMAVAGAAGAVVGVGVGAAILGIAYGVARTIYKMTSQRRRQKLERMVDQLAQQIQARIRHRRTVGDRESLTGGDVPALSPGQ